VTPSDPPRDHDQSDPIPEDAGDGAEVGVGDEATESEIDNGPPSSAGPVVEFRDPFATNLARAFAIIGSGVMVFGVLGLFHSASRTHPGQWVRWWLGGLVVHDLIVAPLVIAFGAFMIGRARGWWRAPLQGGLIATGIVTLVAWPFLRGYGLNPDNPSVLPGNYAWGLAGTLAIIWSITAVIAWRRRGFSRN
jgi:hypothetical protein